MVTLLEEKGNFQRWICLSTDTKPTEGVKNGAEITEIDGGAKSIFNEDAGGWISTSQTAFLRTEAEESDE